MKKFIVGLISGMVLTLSISTYAEEIESYIGKIVEGQFPVIIDGQRADKPGLVIEGTTYLPIRSAGELFGYDVSFIDSQVILNKNEIKEVDAQMYSSEPQENEYKMVSPLGREFDFNKIKLDGIETQLQVLNARLMTLEPSEHIDSVKEELPHLRSEIEFWENVKSQKEAAE